MNHAYAFLALRERQATRRNSKCTQSVEQGLARKVERLAVLPSRAAEHLRRLVGQFELVLLHFGKLTLKLLPVQMSVGRPE